MNKINWVFHGLHIKDWVYYYILHLFLWIPTIIISYVLLTTELDFVSGILFCVLIIVGIFTIRNTIFVIQGKSWYD